jgi:anti-anti-sigma factor
MIDITKRKISNVTVVDVLGKLDTSDSHILHDFLEAETKTGVTNILVNLKNVDYVSSTGLRAILSAGKTLLAKNGKLALCCANMNVLDVLNLSGFSRMFQVYSSEREALAKYT